ncbi:MAG: hypothetical protein ABI600_07040 [Luteolibacter sp.]
MGKKFRKTVPRRLDLPLPAAGSPEPESAAACVFLFTLFVVGYSVATACTSVGLIS